MDCEGCEYEALLHASPEDLGDLKRLLLNATMAIKN